MVSEREGIGLYKIEKPDGIDTLTAGVLYIILKNITANRAKDSLLFSAHLLYVARQQGNSSDEVIVLVYFKAYLSVKIIGM
jgi:hypothetical protein